MSTDQPIWTPDTARIEKTNLTRFRIETNQKYSLNLSSYDDLYRWSVEHPAEFWSEMAELSGIIFHDPPQSILEPDPVMRNTRWFPGATLNFAENLLRYRDERTAIIFRDEAGTRRTLSYAELVELVGRAAGAMRKLGIVKGDRVAGFMPNMPETVIAMLAAASLGAIWSSCSPDFGAQGVVDRFGQIAPKLLITADGYHYAGKAIVSLGRVAAFLETLPTVQQVVVVPLLSDSPDLSPVGERAVHWEEWLEEESELSFEPVEFNHPLYIMYSSGTTGLPKSIVHGHGGTLIQHAKEHMLHTDLKREDTLFYFTTCGWMMWNWLVSGLFTGVALLLYDGNPFHPDGHTLWRIAEEEGVTVFGTSAKYLQAVENARVKPGTEHNLSTLRALLSTGSPLADSQYDWVYSEIKTDLQLASISGGTDIISCFALGNPVGPVWRGELQTRGLGMAVEVFDEAGSPTVGEKGELVCTKPFPSMPVMFWNDESGDRYRGAYYETYGEGIWHHGDYAELTEHGGLIIYGRSDAVLNPGGVRIGTAEIYRVVEQFEEVAEAICVGQKWEGDVRVILFVVIAPGHTLTEELIGRLKRAIREEETPRHVPAKILQVADIPRTISGKITEVAVRKVIHGEPVANRDALKNPEALDLYVDLPELNTN